MTPVQGATPLRSHNPAVSSSALAVAAWCLLPFSSLISSIILIPAGDARMKIALISTCWITISQSKAHQLHNMYIYRLYIYMIYLLSSGMGISEAIHIDDLG